jgi:hypothetical protein
MGGAGFMYGEMRNGQKLVLEGGKWKGWRLSGRPKKGLGNIKVNPSEDMIFIEFAHHI